jgi:hypothetical protein
VIHVKSLNDPLPPLRGRSKSNDQSIPFYPTTPLHIVHAIIAKKAEYALPLVLAAHRRMYIREAKATALTKPIWQAAGLYEASEQRKRTTLQHLRKIPEVLTLIEKPSFIARYWVAYGPLWKRKPKIQIEEGDLDLEFGPLVARRARPQTRRPKI